MVRGQDRRERIVDDHDLVFTSREHGPIHRGHFNP